jgi:4-hydroxybenzoate polyprenyltransferase
MTSETVRQGYWFRPKTFGFGATPATWQGWLVTLGYVLLAALVGNWASHGHPLFVLLLVPLTMGLFWVMWIKTDREWRRRRRR